MLNLKFDMTTLLDNMEHEIDRKYAAPPEHRYVVDAAGWSLTAVKWGREALMLKRGKLQ